MLQASPSIRGFAAILVAAVIFGIAGALAKALFQADVSPVDLTALRTWIASGIFVAMMLLIKPAAFRVSHGSALLLIATALAFTAVNITFYLLISMITVAAAITLEYTAPFFVLAIGVVGGWRRPDLRDIEIVAVSIVGCVLLTGTESEFLSPSLGMILGLACGLSFAIFNMLGNRCERHGIEASTVTLYSFLISSVVWILCLPILTVDKITFADTEIVMYLGFISVVATIIPYWLLIYGLRHVDALPATIIGMLDPVVAGVVAYALIGEHLTLTNILGIALIVVAVSWITMKERSVAAARPHRPPEARPPGLPEQFP